MQRGRGGEREVGGRVVKLQHRAQNCISSPSSIRGVKGVGVMGEEVVVLKYICVCSVAFYVLFM